MFLSISKNACTSLKFLLHRVEFGRDLTPGAGGVHGFFGARERTGPGSVIDRRNTRALARCAGYLRFVIYRDPVSRFLSTYHNKVLWPPEPHRFFTKARLEGSPFDPFLDVVEEMLTRIPDPLHIDEHIRPQRRCFEPEDVDYIVPIEALAQFLEEKLQLTYPARHNEHTGLRIVPSAAQIERIRRLYREDYEIRPNYPELPAYRNTA